MKLGLGPISLAGATRSRLVDLAEQAVAASFDSIWVAEARADGAGGGVAAAAFIAQHLPIRVGAVLDFGAYHPLYAAEDIAVADIASGGRIEVLLRGGSEEQRRLLLHALSGAHLRFDGQTLSVPARLDANQPAPDRLALNPRPLQPAVPIWLMDESSPGFGLARNWVVGMKLRESHLPDLVLCPRGAEADDLISAAGDHAGYFLVPDVRDGRRLVGPLRMPGFPDWINQQ